MFRNTNIGLKENKVTQFKVTVSLDNKKWIEADGGRIFTAIPEKLERIPTYFVRAYYARYIRFYPVSRGNNFAVRLGWIQGCDESDHFLG